MKVVSRSQTFPVPIEKGWDLLCDVERYPRFVPYIWDVKADGPMRKGMVWYDRTSILGVHQHVAHHVDTVKKNKQLVFFVPVLCGKVTEDFRLESVGLGTKVTMTISVTLHPGIVEETVGRILITRFGMMLEKTFEKLESAFNKD